MQKDENTKKRDAQLIAEKIKELCDKNNISINQMLKYANAGERTYHNMVAGSCPSIDKIEKIASLFDISIDYLLGRTNIPEVHKSSILQNGDKNTIIGDSNSHITINNIDTSVSPETMDILTVFSALTYEQQKEVIKYAKYLLDNK